MNRFSFSRLGRSGLLVVGFLATSFAVGVRAEAACVHPDGAGGCETSIQDGVDVADPGEVVDISKGVFFENVVIPAGKDGIILRGKNAKTTILDPDLPNSGSGIQVESNNVVIESLGIRNGQAQGIAAATGTTGLVLTDIAITGPNSACVLNEGTGTSVTGSSFRGCAGIGSSADGLTVEDSDFVLIDGDAIDHRADDLLVTGCTFENIGSNAVGGRGDDLRVNGNKFRNVVRDAFNVSGGSNAEFIDNRVDLAESGVQIQENAGVGIPRADNPTVTGNSFRRLQSAAVDWSCNTTCTQGDFSGNKVSQVHADHAFDLRAPAGALTMIGNRVQDVLESGVLLNLGPDGTASVSGNVFKNTGYESEPTIDLVGGGAAISGNVIVGSGGDGIDIRSAAVASLVAGNRVLRGFGLGIENQAEGTQIAGNKVLRNLGIGLSISDTAIDALVDTNLSRRNGVDYCDAGTDTTLIGKNKFGTQGPCEDEARR